MKRVSAISGMFLLGVFSLTPFISYAASATVTASGVLTHTNVERYRAGLPLLASNDTLIAIAYRKMSDMFTRQYFAHAAPTGEEVDDLATLNGYDYLTVGENLALGSFSSSKDMVDAWMKSPGHKANILSKKYAEVGIAIGRGTYKGKTTWIGVQAFGLPRASCPMLDTALKARVESLKKTIDMLEAVATVRKARLEEDDISRSEYRTRVASYNLVVELYNARATEYRGLVASYNKSVSSFNACVTQKTS